MKIVLGDQGQLAQSLKFIANTQNLEYTFISSKQLNFLNPQNVSTYFSKLNPTVIINTFAYTKVDEAESDKSSARLINTDSVSELAKVCRDKNALLIHFSTDYVYNSSDEQPISENTPADPINYYGQTKLEGERAIQELCNKYYIFRTSWLYSNYGKNFFKTMIRLLQERDEIKIVNDQVGAPTYTNDLAKVISQIAWQNPQHEKYGVYNLCHQGYTSWYDFTKKINELLVTHISGHLSTQILAIASKDYPTAATRPLNSRLDTQKFTKNFDLEMPHWEQGLQSCFAEYLKQSR